MVFTMVQGVQGVSVFAQTHERLEGISVAAYMKESSAVCARSQLFAHRNTLNQPFLVTPSPLTHA